MQGAAAADNSNEVRSTFTEHLYSSPPAGPANPQNTSTGEPLREACLVACHLSRSTLFIETATAYTPFQGFVDREGWPGVFPVAFSREQQAGAAVILGRWEERPATSPRTSAPGDL